MASKEGTHYNAKKKRPLRLARCNQGFFRKCSERTRAQVVFDRLLVEGAMDDLLFTTW